MRIHLHFYLLFLLAFSAFADDIQLDNGSELSVTIYKAKKVTSTLLWIPTEYGVRGKEKETAEQLAKMGIEVWIVDLHASYFIPKGRRSYQDINFQDIFELILKISGKQQREVILFATGRAAPLALNASRQLQLNKQTQHIVKRAILFHPSFYMGTAEAGEDIKYLPITQATNLALFIVQPSQSGKRYQLNTLKKLLQEGGSDVTTKILKDVSDGFNVRPSDNETEEKYYKKTPSIIANAIDFLKHYDKDRYAVNLESENNQKTTTTIKTGLQPYNGNINTLYLDFLDLKGIRHTLKKHQGNVILLNFWATWCPPCVKELPSLNRLQTKINNSQFKILAINIGEETADVKKFLAPMTIKFPVLTDPEGQSVKPWRLIAFPSSFVIDKKGEIRYALFGGLEWDNMEVRNIIQQLLIE